MLSCISHVLLAAIRGCLYALLGTSLVACGRSDLQGKDGCLILGWGKREFKSDTVRVEFGLETLVNVVPEQLAYVWSTTAELSDGPRRLISVGRGTATEAPYITYVEPGVPGEGGVFVDMGIHACESLPAQKEGGNVP